MKLSPAMPRRRGLAAENFAMPRHTRASSRAPARHTRAWRVGVCLPLLLAAGAVCAADLNEAGFGDLRSDIPDDPSSQRQSDAFAALLDHSHSMINKRNKLLIRIDRDSASQSYTVTFYVKLSGTSTGAGFRAVRPNPTMRDRSRSISSGC
jgi:hypothetical protein